MEEESSEHDEAPVVSRPAPVPPPAKKPIPATPVSEIEEPQMEELQNADEPLQDEPFEAIENVMSEIEFAHEQQKQQQQQQEPNDDEIAEVYLPVETRDESASLNDSVLDWEGYDFVFVPGYKIFTNLHQFGRENDMFRD